MKRKKLWVCSHCLMAIESHEGRQPTLRHDIDLEFDEEEFEESSKCDWCDEGENTTLYELV